MSRQLARSRRAIREDVEAQLHASGLNDHEIARCFACVMEDAGPLDLDEILGTADARKDSMPDRSI